MVGGQTSRVGDPLQDEVVSLLTGALQVQLVLVVDVAGQPSLAASAAVSKVPVKLEEKEGAVFKHAGQVQGVRTDPKDAVGRKVGEDGGGFGPSHLGPLQHRDHDGPEFKAPAAQVDAHPLALLNGDSESSGCRHAGSGKAVGAVNVKAGHHLGSLLGEEVRAFGRPAIKEGVPGLEQGLCRIGKSSVRVLADELVVAGQDLFDGVVQRSSHLGQPAPDHVEGEAGEALKTVGGNVDAALLHDKAGKVLPQESQGLSLGQAFRLQSLAESGRKLAEVIVGQHPL